ncbi:hypothetical protein MMC28_010243 [Mycoblastus sanguinarius]|nr:hypothetical protein [Mycoblastus sanguinarius]
MYNTSVEEHRNDHDFWDHYLNQQKSTTGGLAEADLFDGGIIGYSHAVTPDASVEENQNLFKAQSLLFNTRRDLCNGIWNVTNQSILFVRRTCDYPPLVHDAQTIISRNSLVFDDYYPGLLREYVGKFKDPHNQPEWRVPVFTTVIAAMRLPLLSAEMGQQATRRNERHIEY